MNPEETPALKVALGRNGEVTLDGASLNLTNKERKLFASLWHSFGKCVSRETLLEEIWGYTGRVKTRTLDVHIRRLRVKLDGKLRIETVFRTGYRLIPGMGRAPDPETKDASPPPAGSSRLANVMVASIAALGA